MTIGVQGQGLPLPTALFPLQLGIKTASVGSVPGTNVYNLKAGQSIAIPAGVFYVDTGLYSLIQVLDPVTTTWRSNQTQDANSATYVVSDGFNFRVANLTGCPIGAVVTNGGTGYTSVPTVTANSGGSTWLAVVGGAVNVTVVSGAGYTLTPQIIIAAPSSGGVQATAIATLSGSVLTGAVMTNQGAGYASAPAAVVIPDAQDTGNITHATATTTLTGANSVTAVLLTSYGTPQIAAPSLSFAGGGGTAAAATAVPCLTITGVTVTTAGSGFGANTAVPVMGAGGVLTVAPAFTNPFIQTGLMNPRQCNINISAAAGALTSSSTNIIDGGLWQVAPYLFPLGGVNFLLAATMGSANDTIYLQEIGGPA